jgi:hypothetical protein
MRSSAAVPPEQVKRLRSISNSSPVASRLEILPVDGAAITVEKARLGEGIAAGGQRTDAAAAAGQPAQPGKQLPVLEKLSGEPGDDDHVGQHLEVV